MDIIFNFSVRVPADCICDFNCPFQTYNNQLTPFLSPLVQMEVMTTVKIFFKKKQYVGSAWLNLERVRIPLRWNVIVKVNLHWPTKIVL